MDAPEQSMKIQDVPGLRSLWSKVASLMHEIDYGIGWTENAIAISDTPFGRETVFLTRAGSFIARDNTSMERQGELSRLGVQDAMRVLGCRNIEDFKEVVRNGADLEASERIKRMHAKVERIAGLRIGLAKA